MREKVRPLIWPCIPTRISAQGVSVLNNTNKRARAPEVLSDFPEMQLDCEMNWRNLTRTATNRQTIFWVLVGKRRSGGLKRLHDHQNDDKDHQDRRHLVDNTEKPG